MYCGTVVLWYCGTVVLCYITENTRDATQQVCGGGGMGMMGMMTSTSQAP